MTGQLISSAPDSRADGVWTLSGGRAIIAEARGPATMLVPSESVALLSVVLPLASRGRRIAALPFAVEDKIADPIEAVHLALGAQIGPQTYLVAVVRHAEMAAWVEAAEAAGIGHAAIVPDALALPVPGAGEWCVRADAGRVVVRSGDGTGFALPMALVAAAWERAGRPFVWSVDGAPVGDLPSARWAGGGDIGDWLAAPAVDLRQGVYARRGGARGGWGRRLAWIAAAGIVAHIGIAAADAVMLRVIAERRAADVRAAVAQAAPGANLSGDLEASVVAMLPVAGPPPGRFVPLVNATSRALAPLSSAVTARAMRFEGNALILDIDPGPPDLTQRIRDAFAAAGVAAQVTAAPDGAIRATVTA